ncbi:hypothetical protein LCGC14_2237520 [marine sediment metagenome]|uniref:Uncharacterized protein n=1 Tax=marine sediment metagenome TaxID=412755 RepID=A0A0F9G1F3_9ZZZZ
MVSLPDSFLEKTEMTATEKSNGKKSNGSNVKEQLGTMQLDELVSVQVLSMYLVQKLGKASVTDVANKALEIHAEINMHLLDQALEGLRGRGLLSYARGKKTSGESVRMYKVAKVKWASPPEMAHIKDLLPALVCTEEAGRIMRILNGAEEIGDGESKSKRKLGYAEFFEIHTKFRLLNPMIGSQPSSPYLDELVKHSKTTGIKAPVECDLRFWRDDESGDVMIPSDVVCGWIRTAMRYGMDKADSASQYIAADDVRIRPKKLYQVGLPVIDPKDRTGKGISTYELLKKGAIITINFRVPARGILDPKSFVMWLATYAPRPHRGMSPARGRRFGKMELVEYEIRGSSSIAANSLNAVFDSLESDDAKKLYASLLSDATKNKVDFSKAAKGGADAVN